MIVYLCDRFFCGETLYMERYNEVKTSDIDPLPKKNQKPRPKKETVGKPKMSKIFEVKESKDNKNNKKKCKCKKKGK